MSEYRKDALDASEDEEIIGLYDKELHLEMLRNTELHHAEEKGIEQGIEIGREEGMVSRNMEIAKDMLKGGEPLEKISKYTCLSIEEIKKISV